MKSIKKMEKRRISRLCRSWAYITFDDDEEVVLFGGWKFPNSTVYYLRDKELFDKKISYFYSRHPFKKSPTKDILVQLDMGNFFCTDEFVKYRVSEEELAKALKEYGFDDQSELNYFLLAAR